MLIDIPPIIWVLVFLATGSLQLAAAVYDQLLVLLVTGSRQRLHNNRLFPVFP